MNKGFLMFSDDESGLTMLKDEPDDLTHLAPTAGDVCIPLDENPLISDMLNDFLGENYCPLFTDDLQSLDSECSKNSDPFISYHDEFDDNTTSPQLLSPTLSNKSPECTVPSLSSPGNSLGEDEHMNTFISLQMDEDDPDISMKAPYIPMNGGDDFPLLTSNDLMWNAISSTQKPIVNKNDSKLPTNLNTSSLANLLCSTINKANIKPNDQGGGLTIQQTNNRNNMDISFDNRSLSRYKKETFGEDVDWGNLKSSKNIQSHRIDRTSNVTNSNNNNNKRGCSTLYDNSNKRVKNEPKGNLSSELLQQLISNNHQRQRTKAKNGWLLDSGGKTQAACVSQPSDSVLMNLLDQSPPDLNPEIIIPISVLEKSRQKPPDERPKVVMRKNSTSLLDPSAIPSLLDLTQQDYEVNAPVQNFLLQGQDLIQALDITDGLC